MIILGIGTDILEISRINQAVSQRSGFAERLFNQEELAYFEKRNNQPQTITGYFCAKEAVAKAIGTGFTDITPKDIHIGNYENGKPYAKIPKIPDVKFLVSISHCKEYATATAIAYKEE